MSWQNISEPIWQGKDSVVLNIGDTYWSIYYECTTVYSNSSLHAFKAGQVERVNQHGQDIDCFIYISLICRRKLDKWLRLFLKVMEWIGLFKKCRLWQLLWLMNSRGEKIEMHVFIVDPAECFPFSLSTMFPPHPRPPDRAQLHLLKYERFE